MKIPREFWILFGYALMIIAVFGGIALITWAGSGAQ